ncbi:hypothetical protein CEXT_539521 [Caerostris extrusa]|uniref:Uncharacterized protein n=1 Tax=Caerostris extrusa TaxID=172846 RepID=A0AAV4RQ98_CAEEX|nr:hypothetical protein CEXT_539521 [Caerostris extrusa]
MKIWGQIEIDGLFSLVGCTQTPVGGEGVEMDGPTRGRIRRCLKTLNRSERYSFFLRFESLTKMKELYFWGKNPSSFAEKMDNGDFSILRRIKLK